MTSGGLRTELYHFKEPEIITEDNKVNRRHPQIEQHFWMSINWSRGFYLRKYANEDDTIEYVFKIFDIRSFQVHCLS